MNKVLWPLRLILFYAGLIPVTISIATCGWLCAPLPALWCYRIITSWSHFFIWWSRLVCGLKYTVIGRENIPAAPFVVLCNHQSMWETIFMQILIPPQSSILKRELLWIPFFGWGLALIKPIAINRASPSAVKDTLQAGVARLQQGRCIIFYPEGTRVLPGVQRRYSRSGAALAIAGKVPVLAIAHNAGNFWPKGLWIKQPGTITVSIAPPINTNGLDATAITTQAEAWINQQKSMMLPGG